MIKEFLIHAGGHAGKFAKKDVDPKDWLQIGEITKRQLVNLVNCLPDKHSTFEPFLRLQDGKLVMTDGHQIGMEKMSNVDISKYVGYWANNLRKYLRHAKGKIKIYTTKNYLVLSGNISMYQDESLFSKRLPLDFMSQKSDITVNFKRFEPLLEKEKPEPYVFSDRHIGRAWLLQGFKDGINVTCLGKGSDGKLIGYKYSPHFEGIEQFTIAVKEQYLKNMIQLGEYYIIKGQNVGAVHTGGRHAVARIVHEGFMKTGFISIE